MSINKFGMKVFAKIQV